MPHHIVSPAQAAAIEKLRTVGIYHDRPATKENAYFVVDPGVTSGWAMYADNGFLVDFGQIAGGARGMKNHMREFPTPPLEIIYEVYQIRGRGQQLPPAAVETLGVMKALKEYGRLKDIPVAGLQAANKGVAERLTGLLPGVQHAHTHWVDAVNHGWWYMLHVKKKVIPTLLWGLEPRESVSE